MKRPLNLYQLEMNSVIAIRFGTEDSYTWVGLETKELLGTRGTFRYAHSLKQARTYFRRLIATIIGCRIVDIDIKEKDIKEL